MKLTAAYKKVDDGWAARVEEIPGVNTQGETLEEAHENLKDVLRMVLEANRELSEKGQEATRREDLMVARDAPIWKSTYDLTAANLIAKAESIPFGGIHSSRKTSPVPWQREINDYLVRGICRSLDVARP